MRGFCTLFRAGPSFVALISLGQFLQTVINSARRTTGTSLDITTPSVLEVQLFFHSIVKLRAAAHAIDVKCSTS